MGSRRYKYNDKTTKGENEEEKETIHVAQTHGSRGLMSHI